MISAHQLTKTYRSITALDVVSISVNPGEICGIVGPNGAGKTTLFKIICGLITPDSGTYQIDSGKTKPVGAIIEKPALFEYLSAYENLWILSMIQGAPSDKDTINGKLAKVGLPLERKDPVRHFSLGMKQRLGIAIALLNDPDCLILDEPFLGLDPLGMSSVSKLINQLAKEHQLAILVSSHLLDELSRVCDTLYVLSNGRLIQSGITRDIIHNSTDRYMICGRNIAQSEHLQSYTIHVSGDCVSVQLKETDAPSLLRALIDEGNDITFFGPEKNLDRLYQGK